MIISEIKYFHWPHSFKLESGASLPEITIGYHTYGTLNADKSNAVWVCHALTANSDAADWWAGVIGKGKAIDPEKHFIVCANIIGSCYGSTGPLSINAETGKPYYGSFPQISIRDMVKAHILLRKHLGIEKIYLLMGGSMGGYQAMEWCLTEEKVIENLFLIATSAAESAWGIAIHTAQRLAIEADGSWMEQRPDAAHKGLKAARAIGMLTYRNYETMVKYQSDPDPEKTDHYKAESYIQYQGDKLVKRFNAYSYWFLSKAMDSHNLARGRGRKLEDVLAGIRQKTLIVGISSDILCPVAEQIFLHEHIPGSYFVEIHSAFGHDGFLVEGEAISGILAEWMKKK
jgi:homoserine O-acetyltransferase